MSNIISAHTKRHIIKYKYGVKIPKRFKGAIKAYQENSNTLWKYMIGREMAQNKRFRILKPLKRGTKAPDNHIFLPVHICFTSIFISGGQPDCETRSRSEERRVGKEWGGFEPKNLEI